MSLRLIYAVAVAAVLGLAVRLPMSAAGIADSLAPGGTLRVAFLGGNPVQGRVDSKTGEISGPVADMTRELARRLGVPYKIIPGENPKAVMDMLKAHTADLGFLAFDATRAAEVDFSQPYSLAHNTYLVPSDSPIHSIADIDRKGIRVLAPKGDTGELFLTRTLKNAELKSVPGATVEDAQKMFAASEIDAFATNRQRLMEAAARLPNVRVLPDNFYDVEQSLAVSKGDLARVVYLSRLIADLRSSGFLKAMLDRAKLGGVDVAPPRLEP